MEAIVVTAARFVALALIALVSVAVGGTVNLLTAGQSPSDSAPRAGITSTPSGAPCPKAGCRASRARPPRYVSPRGSDSNPGTLARPWRTIGKAMRTLAPGRTAYLRAGTYREATDVPCGPKRNAIQWRRSGRPGASITISGYPGEEKKVVVKTLINIYGDHLRLTNLVIDRNASHSSFDDACTGSVNVAVYGNHIELVGLEVRNAMMSGIYVSKAGQVKVVRSWIHDNGTHEDLDHGLYIGSSTGLLLANSLIEDNLAYGIHLYPGGTHGARILHNTVVGHGRAGLILSGDSSRNTIANNIFARNDEYGLVEYQLEGGGNVAVRNLYHENGIAPSRLRDRLQETEPLFGNPRFFNIELHDFRLRRGSAALGRAFSAYVMPRDYAGKLRPLGSGPDVGAFER